MPKKRNNPSPQPSPRKAGGASKKTRTAPISLDPFSPLLPADDLSSGRDYTVRGKVWRWKGGAWHFVTLGAKQSAEIKRRFGGAARGWGSIKVRVKIGDTEWETSIFPTESNKAYLFAIKKEVRKHEDIDAGDTVTATVTVL